jgi:tetratricopeptide (TPR) repeat protein
MNLEATKRAELARAKHQQALELMDKQHLDGALRLFGEALAQEETCGRWNDWAVAQFTRNQFADAEQGFRYALELDPSQRVLPERPSRNLGDLRSLSHSTSKTPKHMEAILQTIVAEAPERGRRGRGIIAA